jgi:hypothetical protein
MKTMFGTWRFEWRDIDGEFQPYGSYVIFNVTTEALARLSRWRRWNFRTGRAVAGGDCQISATIFGRSGLALAQLLNDQRTRRMRLHPAAR